MAFLFLALAGCDTVTLDDDASIDRRDASASTSIEELALLAPSAPHREPSRVASTAPRMAAGIDASDPTHANDPTHATDATSRLDSTNAIDALPTDALDDDREPEPPASFQFVIHHGRTFVVLRTQTSDAWGTGALTLLSREGPTVVVRDVVRSRLPSDVPARGARYTLREDARAVCEVELGALRLLRRVDADFVMADRWRGEEGGEPQPDDVVAHEAWELVPSAELLVAEARTIAGDCANAHWGHPSSASPDVGGPATIGTARLVSAFRALDAHRELQAAWQDAREYDEHPHVAQWDARPGARSILRFTSHTGRRFALVTAQAHGGCGDFTGGLHALFEVPTRGAPILVTSDRIYDATPRLLVDVDRDDVPEIVFDSRIVHRSHTTDVTTPFLGCPC